MKLTKELLIKHEACKEGIDFFERNKLEGFPLNRLEEIKGDFEGYIGWIEDTDFNGLVKSREFVKDPLCTYDSNGNRLSYENSYGFWYKNTYDKNGNVLSYETSSGFWWKSTYYKDGNILSFEDSGGGYITYTYNYYLNKQLKSIHENGEEILNIPLI